MLEYSAACDRARLCFIGVYSKLKKLSEMACAFLDYTNGIGIVFGIRLENGIGK